MREVQAFVNGIIPLDLASRQLRLAILVEVVGLLMHQLVMLEWLLLTCMPSVQVWVDVNVISKICILTSSKFTKGFLGML